MVVPTWNYVVVEARGIACAIEDRDWLLKLVRDLTEVHEQERENAWHVDDAPPDYIEKMLNGIVGFEISVRSLEGKWKMNQNRSAEDRAGVVEGLRRAGSAAALAVADLIAGQKS